MLRSLDFLLPGTPLEGPEQMALDEILLRQLSRPLLRCYAWKAPCVTFGYFEKWTHVLQAFPTHALEDKKFFFVRRSTGGGCVVHGEDLTFSLMIPNTESLGTFPPLLVYKTLHETVAAVLKKRGISARLTTLEETSQATLCFAAPALYDLLWEGKKILGGAQRRRLGTLLYQGSLALPSLKKDMLENFPQELATHLASHVETIAEDPRLLQEASILAAARYRSASWTQKR